MNTTTASLAFPFATAPGEKYPVRLARGIYWLKLPLPSRLDHVNSWLLEDEAGWLIIDCGFANEQILGIWNDVMDGRLKGKPVREILITHAHLDHIGALGSLAERWGVVPRMSHAEYMNAALRAADTIGWMQTQTREWLRWCGGTPEMIAELLSRRVIPPYDALPRAFRRIANGDRLTWGDRSWDVFSFGGHATEMIALFSPEDHILIAADQVLPKITPSINVPVADPVQNTLDIFLTSFDKLAHLPDDTLVLPSHGDPFYGVHKRIGDIRLHHAERLDELHNLVDKEVTAWEAAFLLFERAMGSLHARHAISETLAHLNYLESRKRMARTIDASGVARFKPV